VRRDRSLDGEPENSAPTLGDTLASPISSPSTQAMRREEADALAEALERLPADYRTVILLRNLEGVAFEEIASRMGRSPSAVRMLWERALVKLSQTLERPP
jgi:RNA polymerase sigma-70 factor (ECF subfamily)